MEDSSSTSAGMRAVLSTTGFRKLLKSNPAASQRAVEALMTLLDTDSIEIHGRPLDFLNKWIQLAVKPNIGTLSARTATENEVVSLFNLVTSDEQTWRLSENSVVEAPKQLIVNLNDLYEARYSTDSEATSRIRIDIMLIQCRLHLRRKYARSQDKEGQPATPKNSALDGHEWDRSGRIKIIPKHNLALTMLEPGTDRNINVNGRADWVLGYESRGDVGGLLIAVEAKRKTTIGEGHTQLLTYLAILREQRMRANKTNTLVQGFYSDGRTYAFMCIQPDGSVFISKYLTATPEEDINLVFSFIVTMLDTAIKSTPSSSPTKPGPQRDLEINDYKEVVWDPAFEMTAELVRQLSEMDIEE